MARLPGNKKSGASRRRLQRVMLLMSAIACLLLILLFLLPEKERPGRAAGQPQRPDGGTPAAAAPERVEPLRLAVVIDDVGYNLQDLEPFLEFPGPLAFAVLPRLANSREAAARIRGAGKELLLHCPMEPLNGEDSGPGTLLTGQPEQSLQEALALNLDSVPGALGLNNHMGSRFTSDVPSMRAVMASLQSGSLFFLDSRTTADSVCRSLAAEFGIPFLERDIFIDNERSVAYIKTALREGLRIAERRGYAILIGHVYSDSIPEVLNMLADEEDNWRLTSLVDLLALEPWKKETLEP